MKPHLIGIIIFAMLSAASLTGCAGASRGARGSAVNSLFAASPSTQSADAAWTDIPAILGRPGVLHENVYAVAIPRDDLDIGIEGVDVPAGAGTQSMFWFYRCPCGKMNVVGQFIAADYEANDVVDALRAGQLKIASTGPALLYEKPRLLLIRFQGEGDAATLARAIREAVRWTGKERMAPRKMQ